MCILKSLKDIKTSPFFCVFCVMQAAVKDEAKRGHYREKIKGYMDRAEQIKSHVNQLKEGTVVHQ